MPPLQVALANTHGGTHTAVPTQRYIHIHISLSTNLQSAAEKAGLRAAPDGNEHSVGARATLYGESKRGCLEPGSNRPPYALQAYALPDELSRLTRDLSGESTHRNEPSERRIQTAGLVRAISLLRPAATSSAWV